MRYARILLNGSRCASATLLLVALALPLAACELVVDFDRSKIDGGTSPMSDASTTPATDASAGGNDGGAVTSPDASVGVVDAGPTTSPDASVVMPDSGVSNGPDASDEMPDASDMLDAGGG